jgi:hypothetical protein
MENSFNNSMCRLHSEAGCRQRVSIATIDRGPFLSGFFHNRKSRLEVLMIALTGALSISVGYHLDRSRLFDATGHDPDTPQP